MIAYLEANQGSAKYLVAATGSQTTAPIIIATGKPVVTIGGFNGGDNAPTVAQLAAMVAAGELKYVLLGGGGGGPGGGKRGDPGLGAAARDGGDRLALPGLGVSDVSASRPWAGRRLIWDRARMELKAVLLNCTLKKSPEPSNTQGADRHRHRPPRTTSASRPRSMRPVDYNIPFGVDSDLGDGDEWPQILEKILAADILIMGMSIWFGVRNSVCQMVIERLDGTYNMTNDVGQYPMYNKVGGVVVTGNEDGAHASRRDDASSTSPTWASRSRPTPTPTGSATPAPGRRSSRPAARSTRTR